MRNVLCSQKTLLLAGILFTCASSLAQVTEKWVKRQNGGSNGPDAVAELVVDYKNNVIVTGWSEGKGTSSDIATVKYNDDGDTKWVKRYNGPGNSYDVANAAAVDNKGNVYVTGYSTGISSLSDLTTIKYDEEGNTKWVKRFNGAGNGFDEATAIAVDDEGNVYVTGWVTGNGTDRDITTIKYDYNGNVKWIKNYNGPGNGWDEATSIAVDHDGNVYVGGGSTGIGTGEDYTTIKYNKNGELKWVSRFNGPINNFDRVNALAVDDNGNVYVTGLRTLFIFEFEGFDSDIATIKYNAAGVQQWAVFYNRREVDRAKDLAVDKSGNVYITGVSGPIDEDPLNDYITVKYNTGGVQQWAAVFSGTGIGNGQEGAANDLVLDEAGNVYVTGGIAGINYTDFATVKYNTNGVQQWVASYNGPGNGSDMANAIGLDNKGNVYITGGSPIDNSDYTTIKYNSAGMQKWLRRYNNPGNIQGGPDYATALAVDKNGNVHVTGGVTRLNTGLDYTTLKYSTTGDREWKKTYNGPGIGPDQASAITLDTKRNVYITGSSFGRGSQADYATVKYDEEGHTQWGKRYNGPGNGTDEATAIATDENGNVYVTGSSIGNDAFGDYATIKYDKDGNTKWIKRYDGPGHALDRATAIAVDAAGNVYVTGRSIGNGSLEDYATIKYNASGNQLWVIRYNGPDNSIDEPNALVVDAFGNVYVTGGSTGIGTVKDYATIKYNTAGVQQWVVRYNNNYDDAKDITLDAAGNVYVTGYSGNNGDLDDYATIKYNAAGIQQWVARYDAANSQDYANALVVDAQGNVYVTGASRLSNNSFEDYATVKYNAAGVQQWVARYNGTANNTDVATDIGLDKIGNVYVTGHSFGDFTWFDYTTIKYEQTPLITTRSVTGPQPANQAPEQRGLVKLTAKAFPNAFTQYINLQWSGSDKPVDITITDAMGRLVEKRTGLASGGTLKTGSNFPQGIYYAEFIQGKEKVLLKLVKN